MSNDFLQLKKDLIKSLLIPFLIMERQLKVEEITWKTKLKNY